MRHGPVPPEEIAARPSLLSEPLTLSTWKTRPVPAGVAATGGAAGRPSATIADVLSTCIVLTASAMPTWGDEAVEVADVATADAAEPDDGVDTAALEVLAALPPPAVAVAPESSPPPPPQATRHDVRAAAKAELQPRANLGKEDIDLDEHTAQDAGRKRRARETSARPALFRTAGRQT